MNLSAAIILLVDQGLSHKLARRMAGRFPDSTNVREVGWKEADVLSLMRGVACDGGRVILKGQERTRDDTTTVNRCIQCPS
jgi:hypothetical protein